MLQYFSMSVFARLPRVVIGILLGVLLGIVSFLATRYEWNFTPAQVGGPQFCCNPSAPSCTAITTGTTCQPGNIFPTQATCDSSCFKPIYCCGSPTPVCNQGIRFTNGTTTCAGQGEYGSFSECSAACTSGGTSSSAPSSTPSGNGYCCIPASGNQAAQCRPAQ